MKLTGIKRSDGRTDVAAVVDGGVVPLADVSTFWADPFGFVERGLPTGSASVLPWEELHVVPPVRPDARILCVGLNYTDHVAEGPFNAPDHPTIFGRWTPSLAVSGHEVAVPVDEEGLDWEAELLAVVGRPLSVATRAEAAAGIFAYACFNDLTARRAQKLTTQWTIGKNVDNSGPMSDLVTVDQAPDPATGLRITTRVNGELTQDARTDQMIFDVPDLLAFISRSFSLRPGDLVATGTPSGVGYARSPAWLLQPSDHVEVEIEGIGTVRTDVV
jgi:2,4-didehydro-3-deoxy-L-rhamnonate hydrolase